MTFHEPNLPITISASDGLWDWMQAMQLSFAFSTYQSNRLFLVGCKPDRRLAVNERLFDKPMGLYARDNQLYMACRYQIWQLENRLADGEHYADADRLYVPATAYTTGDLNVHDVVMTQEQQLIFINTDFSCLATLKAGYSFEPLWQPPFISQLVAEDRCHLNGLAMQNGEPTYVTACSASDEAAGWRNHRLNGGVVIHIPSNDIIATGLSMPHSPRWYRGKLWLLNSGSGEFGYVDAGRFVPVTFCAGFVRGLAFFGDYALVGLSKLRSTSQGGLALETRLAAQGYQSQCGLVVIDLNTGQIIHSFIIHGEVEELFDVVVLPNVQQPNVLGFQTDDISRLINFPQSNGIITTKPTVQRAGIGQAVPIAGLSAETNKTTVKYQRVYHLTPDNLLPYEAMTYPSLQTRWQTQPPRGELLGLSASVAGEMIGFAVADCYQVDTEPTAELISLYVLPAYHQQGIESNLTQQLQILLNATVVQ